MAQAVLPAADAADMTNFEAYGAPAGAALLPLADDQILHAYLVPNFYHHVSDDGYFHDLVASLVDRRRAPANHPRRPAWPTAPLPRRVRLAPSCVCGVS